MKRHAIVRGFGVALLVAAMLAVGDTVKLEQCLGCDQGVVPWWICLTIGCW